MTQDLHQSQNEMEITIVNPYSRELLEALLYREVTYPWDHCTLESQAYLDNLEQEFSLLDDLDDLEVEERSNNFFAQLDQVYSLTPLDKVTQALMDKFGTWISTQWLEAIATQAEQVIKGKLTPMTELVQCVQPLLSNWEEADLQLFARPLVYTMRSKQENGTETTINNLKQTQWQDLSEIEQARSTLAIANYALKFLKTEV